MRKTILFAKRTLTGLMAAALLVTALPSYAFAAQVPAEETEEAAVPEVAVAPEEGTTLQEGTAPDETWKPEQELPREDADGPADAEDADVAGETDGPGEEYREEPSGQEITDMAEEEAAIQEATDTAWEEEPVPEEASEEERLGADAEKIFVVFATDHCTIEVYGSGVTRVQENPPQYRIMQKTVEGELENYTSFTFNVKPDEGYTMDRSNMPVPSCGTISGLAHPMAGHERDFQYTVKAPEDPGYFTGEQSGDIKVLTIQITAVEAVNVTFDNTGVAGLKFRSGSNGFVRNLKGNTADVVKGKDLYITGITPAEGYTVDGATVQAGASEEKAWSASTPVSKAVSAETQVKVTCVRKEHSSVAVTYRIDKKEYDEDTSKAYVIPRSGVEDGKTTDGDIVFSVMANRGYMTDNVSYVIGTGAAVTLEPGGDGNYVIEKEIVKAAEAARKNIRIDVTTKGAEFELDDRTKNGSVFATSQAVMGEGDIWNFKDPDVFFTFTVTTPVSVLPKVMVAGQEADAKDSVIDAKYTKRTYTYTVKTTDLQDHTLTISDETEFFTLTADISGSDAVDSVSVLAEGQYYSHTMAGNRKLVFKIPAYQMITVSAPTLSSYYVNKFKCAPAGGGIFSVDAKDNTATFRLTDTMTVTPEADGNPVLVTLDENGIKKDVISDKATIALGAADTLKLAVWSKNKRVWIETVTARIGKADVAGFAKKNQDAKGRYVAIDASAAADKGTKPVVVSVTDETGKTWTVNFTVAQNPTTVTLKGFNKNTKAVSQVKGTKVSYGVTLNNGAAYDSIAVDVKTGDTDNEARAEYDADSRTLTVWTEDRGILTDDDFTINFYRVGDSQKTPIDTFTVHPTKANDFAAPTVTLTSASDIDMTFSLSIPRALKDYENLYYHIEANGVDNEHSDTMVQAYNEWQPAGPKPTSCRMYLMKAPGKEWGNGHAKKYNVKVTIIQVSDENGGFGESCESNCLVRGKTKELKKQSTKDPYYETKMSLTKKTTSFTLGEKNVLLAVAKFSKSTSYTAVGSAYLANDDSCEEYRADCMAEGDGSIILPGEEDAEDLIPGKYTLYVWPKLPHGETYSKPATMPVTIKAPVTGIEMDAPCSRIYKAPGKAASFTVKATCYSENELGSVKPADSKLVWTAEAVDPDSSLNDFLTCKDGKITIQKGYICSADPNKNKIKVTAKAADLGDAGTENSMTFTLSANAMGMNSLSIGYIRGVDKNPTAYISSDFSGESIRVNGEEIDINDVTVSVTPSTGLYIIEDRVYPEKAGTYTLKVTAKDGSNLSISKKFAVKNDELDPEEPYLIEAYQQTGNNADWWMDENILSFDGNDTAQASGAVYLVIHVKPNTLHGSYEDVVCENKAKVVPDTKTAKKVSMVDLPQDYTVLVPTSDTVKVKVSWPGEERMLTIKNTPRDGKLTPKMPFEFYNLDFSDKELEFGLEISQTANLSGSYLAFSPLPTALAKEKDADAARDFCYKMEARGSLEIDTERTKAVYILSDELENVVQNRIANGKYTCNVSLVDRDDHPLTNPVPVTFTIKDAPKPKALLNKAVTFQASGAGETLTFKTRKDVAYFSYAEVMDPLENGGVAKYKLSDYFTVDYGNGKLVLERKNKALPAGVTQMTGYVRYRPVGLDYHQEIECIDPITVTITDPAD
ncbi:MAG: hypothetical protein J5518_12390 [Lachnospiraceae bacterium]|nr:hypothetical protein [Lachnospiraceae bacterium]